MQVVRHHKDIETDPIAIALDQYALQARHQYLKYIQIPCQEKFLSETRGFVFDKEHVHYSIFKSCDKQMKPFKKTQKLYLNLAKVIHPDKCLEPWASKMFIILQNKSNSLEDLEELTGHWQTHQTFQGSKWLEPRQEKPIDVSREIFNMENSLWYVWCISSSLFHAILHDVLVHPERIKRAKDDLRKKIENLEYELCLAQSEKTNLQCENAVLKMRVDRLESKGVKV